MFSRSLRISAERLARSSRTYARRFSTEEAKKAGDVAKPMAAAAAGGGAAGGAAAGGGGSSAALPIAALALMAGGFSIYQATEMAELAALIQLKERVDDLQIQLSGKTNSAFVFIKPHACKGSPGKVEALVEEAFKKNGMRITSQGAMAAEIIDKNMHIDTHYGAIASKAVKLKPSELNVPDKGKADFEKMFGEKWDDAVKAGKVYNAMDGAKKLGVDSAGLNEKWSKLARGKDLVKFGGGFYCGKVDGIYVINGFYMSMRSAYCSPGEMIRWYTVTWPADSLSWADFRGIVLGATDPSAAPKGSIRRSILDRFKELGLKTKPDTGDNGVHASASPFEALAERMNWLGVKVEDDPFGKGLLAAGVPKRQIMKWCGDAQVAVDGETDPGKTTSVFDALEDLDSDVTLVKVVNIH